MREAKDELFLQLRCGRWATAACQQWLQLALVRDAEDKLQLSNHGCQWLQLTQAREAEDELRMQLCCGACQLPSVVAAAGADVRGCSKLLRSGSSASNCGQDSTVAEGHRRGRACTCIVAATWLAAAACCCLAGAAAA